MSAPGLVSALVAEWDVLIGQLDHGAFDFARYPELVGKLEELGDAIEGALVRFEDERSAEQSTPDDEEDEEGDE
jgi:hypothetical protein